MTGSSVAASEQRVQEIEAADNERFRAKCAKDAAGLARVLADELVYVHSSAAIDTKASLIEGACRGKYHYRSAVRRDVQVRDYADMALMTGKVTIEVTVNGAGKTVNATFTSAWVMRDGRWQMATWQTTSLPQ